MKITRWIFCIAFLLLSVPLMAQDAPSDQTVAAFEVSESEAYDNRGPQIASDSAGNLHIVWRYTDPTIHGNGELMHRSKSPDGTWSEATNLSAIFSYWGEYRLVRKTSGGVCVYMAGTIAGFDPRIHERCLINGTWQDPALVNMLAPVLGLYEIAYDSANMLHAIYNGGNRVILGSTGEPLGDAPYGIRDQFVIDAAGGYHVAWVNVSEQNNYIILYRYSGDGGANWTPEQRLSEQGDVRDEHQPQMVADAAGSVHLLYVTRTITAGLTATVEYRKWTPDAGWSDAVVIAESSGLYPDLDVDADGLAYATWHVIDRVNFARQLPDGTWTEPDNTVLGETFVEDAVLHVDADGTVHIAYSNRIAHQLEYVQLPR